MTTNSSPSDEARPIVYVVDDDEAMRASSAFLLRAGGLRAATYANGTDFVADLGRIEKGVILLDIRMPGIDGFEVLRLLSEGKVPWPVIVMTAHGDLDVAVEAMRLGAMDFLEKPFREEAVLVSLGHASKLLSQ